MEPLVVDTSKQPSDRLTVAIPDVVCAFWKVEWVATREKFQENDAERPPVKRACVLLAAKDFWWTIFWCATQSGAAALLRDVFGPKEVAQPLGAGSNCT